MFDAFLTLLALFITRGLDISHEMLPELTETLNSFLNPEAQSVWSELKLNDLEAAFSLCGYSTIICLLVLLFENILFFMATLFPVSQLSLLTKFFIHRKDLN